MKSRFNFGWVLAIIIMTSMGCDFNQKEKSNLRNSFSLVTPGMEKKQVIHILGEPMRIYNNEGNKNIEHLEYMLPAGKGYPVAGKKAWAVCTVILRQGKATEMSFEGTLEVERFR